MNQYLLIENQGEAELLALTLMGASTKRNEADKIGMFGTGFKNAVSILLRNNIHVEMFFGTKRICFATRPVSFRDTQFNQIVLQVDGREIETGFTTDMGLRWKADGALRELVSNALDETCPLVAVWDDGEPAGLAGRTRVFVAMSEDVKAFHQEAGKHFLKLREGKPLYEFVTGTIWPRYESNGTRIYRRGVLVHEHKLGGCFDYEFNDATIDEERKANDWNVYWELGHNIDKFPIEAKAEVVPHLSRESFEAHCTNFGALTSPDWQAVFANKVACSASVLDGPFGNFIDPKMAVRVSECWETALAGAGVKTSAQMLSHIQKAGGSTVTPTNMEERGLAWVINFFGHFGLKVTREEIQVFESQGTMMGEYDPTTKTIYIARQCITRGRRFLAVTMLEEISHRDSGATDFSRAFQDYVFEQWLNSLERESGEYL